MKKANLLVPFQMRQVVKFSGPNATKAAQELVRVLGLHRMTVALIAERIKWFEGEHVSENLPKMYLTSAAKRAGAELVGAPVKAEEPKLSHVEKLLKSFAVRGDLAADAVEAVKRYAEVEDNADRVADFARSVARELETLARELEYDQAYGEALNKSGDHFDCPAGDGSISEESSQADPCATCHRVYHDACFYTKAHACVRAGVIEERPGYGIKEAIK